MHDTINPTTLLYDPVMNVHESVLTFSIIVKFLLWKTIKLVSLSTRNSINASPEIQRDFNTVKHAINIKEFMSSSRNMGFKTPGTNGWQSDSGLKIAVMNNYNTPLTL